MADTKFSQFADGLTNQSPTDVLVGLDLSLSASQQNTKWTLDSLFSNPTRNITDKAMRWNAPGGAPSVSAAGEASLYFDGSVFQISYNGGAYAALGVGGGISGGVSGKLIKASSATTGTDSGIVSTEAANSVSSRKNVLDYASLAAAVAAIGSSTVTTLVIPVSTAVAASLTITKNITLQFTNSGSLALANGAIVNHYGGIDASPNQQIFFRTGTGRIVFGGADATNGATQQLMIPAPTSAQIPAFYPQWWGVKGDWINGVGGTDDTAAWQALLNVIPNDCRIIIPPNTISKITSTLNLNNRRGVVIAGVAGGGEASTTAEPQAMFMWLGANGSTVLQLGRCRNCVFQNILIAGAINAASLTGADIGIYLNNGGGTAGDISSNNIFNRCFIVSGSIRDTWVAVKIGNPANGSNDEFHTFNECNLYGSIYGDPNIAGGIPGTCVYITHPNCKKITFNRCNLSQARYVMYLDSGSFSMEDCAVGYSMTAFWLNGWSDTISINRIDSEGLVQLIKTNPGSDAPLRLSHGRYDRVSTIQNCGTPANPFIDLGGGNNLVIENNFFGQWFQNTNATWYTNNTQLFKATTGASVWWKNNTISSYRPDYLYTNFITAKLVVFNDEFYFTNTLGGVYSSITGTLSTATLRQMIGVQQAAVSLPPITTNQGLYACALNSLFLGEGQVECVYLGTPNPPYLRLIGTTGATQYQISIIARDANGNRSLRSQTMLTATANATLSGSDYVAIDWQTVPNAADYLILQTDPTNTGAFRVIATVAAPTVTYNLTANPAGAFTYTNPSYNETSILYRRAQVADAVTITFTDADTTPSVAQTNQFTATNTGATTITNFDDGVNGQTIWVLFTNANTTLQQNATIKLRSGANVTPAASTMYSFTRRGGVWYEN